MGKGTSGPDKPGNWSDRSSHPVEVPANRPGTVVGKWSGRHPNVPRKESHDIDELVPDIPAQVPLSARTSPGEPGDATAVLPCRRTDS